MIIRTPPEIVARYEQDLNSINQSGLKEIMFNGIQSFLVNQQNLLTSEKYFEDKQHFLIGKATDTLISYGRNHFNTIYHNSDVEKQPSATLKTVLHMVMEKLQNEHEVYPLNHSNAANYMPLLHEALNTVETVKDGELKIGYYMNRAKPRWDMDNRITDVLRDDACMDYWADIVRARGKQVLSTEEYNLINIIYNNWVTHPYTKNEFEDSKDIVDIYQLPIYFLVDKTPCKGLIDKVRINLITNKIIPYDFKTMRGFTLNFPRIVKSRRYDIQGAFYTEGLRQNFALLGDIIGSTSIYNFSLDNMHFIVESTSNPGLPLRFRLDDGAMWVGEKGDDNMPGFRQLVEEYAYWREHDFNIESALNKAVPEALQIDSRFNLIKPV
jgi:hypothetical protein